MHAQLKNMQYNRHYRNSLVIVDVAMGQIPRSTERFSGTINIFRDCENANDCSPYSKIETIPAHFIEIPFTRTFLVYRLCQIAPNESKLSDQLNLN